MAKISVIYNLLLLGFMTKGSKDDRIPIQGRWHEASGQSQQPECQHGLVSVLWGLHVAESLYNLLSSLTEISFEIQPAVSPRSLETCPSGRHHELVGCVHV